MSMERPDYLKGNPKRLEELKKGLNYGVKKPENVPKFETKEIQGKSFEDYLEHMQIVLERNHGDLTTAESSARMLMSSDMRKGPGAVRDRILFKRENKEEAA